MTDHYTAATQAAGRTPLRRSRTPAGAAPRAEPEGADLGRLTGHLGYLVRRAQIWIFQDFIRTLAEIDIRPAQYSILIVIEANPGLSQAVLAQTLGIERARLVHLLDELEARKLVQRRRSASDRRSHALSLTAQGRGALARTKALADQHEQRLMRRVGVKGYKALLRHLAVFAYG